MSTDDEQHLTPLAQHVVFVYCFVCGLFCLTELLFYVCCLFLGEVSCFVYVIEKLYCSLPLHLIDPILQQLACHAIHPQQQSQKFDSKLDSGSHSQPKNRTEISIKETENLEES